MTTFKYLTFTCKSHPKYDANLVKAEFHDSEPEWDSEMQCIKTSNERLSFWIDRELPAFFARVLKSVGNNVTIKLTEEQYQNYIAKNNERLAIILIGYLCNEIRTTENNFTVGVDEDGIASLFCGNDLEYVACETDNVLRWRGYQQFVIELKGNFKELAGAKFAANKFLKLEHLL